MTILYSEKSMKQLEKICKGDRKNADSIIRAIESYSLNPSGNSDIKVLRGKFGDFKRLRIGSYRVIFEDDGCIMRVLEVKHRQGAYHD